jgi:hypothetical protein
MSALLDARESLDYWERRARTLPRWAVRKRREARAMAERWNARVGEAERAQYGAGLLGAALMLVIERRLPVGARHAGRQLMRVTTRVLLACVVLLATALVAAGVVAFEVLRALF